MHDEMYSDGIGEITVSGSIVRVDLVSLSPTERDANNSPKSVFRQRIIFSVEGFANSVDVMQKALQSLVDTGVIRRNAPEQAGNGPMEPASGEHRTVLPGPSRRNVSPNFS